MAAHRCGTSSRARRSPTIANSAVNSTASRNCKTSPVGLSPATFSADSGSDGFAASCRRGAREMASANPNNADDRRTTHERTTRRILTRATAVESAPAPMKKFYLTTAINYVNDDPHIGHMYEAIVADVITRHRRRMGDDVRFLTGTDEHGMKIERAAAKEGILPIELADGVVSRHHDLLNRLGIGNDDFIRTTEARHRVGVLELINRIQEHTPDDIYLGEHSGWYCQSEETFIPENQVRDGVDQDGHKVEWTTERNYFFALSRYTERLLTHYRTHPEFVWPPTRLNEVIAFVEQGLKDLSISRTSITWGIPFPGNPEHVIYVWMEALTNYISALGFGSGGEQPLFDRYWPADINLARKDVVRFHAVYWPAFLMAAGVELPTRIVGHGFWLRDQQKISKSLGNVVRPYNILDRSEEHTSELQSPYAISYAVFCLKKTARSSAPPAPRAPDPPPTSPGCR